MSDQFKEIADIPKDFLRDGTQFLNRCTKRASMTLYPYQPRTNPLKRISANSRAQLANKREFIKISQAVGVGFVVMGALGYIVKLST